MEDAVGWLSASDVNWSPLISGCDLLADCCPFRGGSCDSMLASVSSLMAAWCPVFWLLRVLDLTV